LFAIFPSRRTRVATDATVLVAKRLEELRSHDKLSLERAAPAVACARRYTLLRCRLDGCEPDGRRACRLDDDLLTRQRTLDE
jgi:hypothetical protein